MKKLVSLTLAVLLALMALAVPTMAEEPPKPGPRNMKCGMLSMLNLTEEEYALYKSLRVLAANQLIREEYGTLEGPEGQEPPAEGERPPMEGQEPPAEGERPPMEGQEPPAEGERLPMEGGEKHEIVYYDTLDAMLMGLEAGEIGSIEIYQSVGEYLCATNDNLRLPVKYDMGKERARFAELILDGLLGNDFSFLMLEDNAALRDSFNAAILEMKADGTLDRLVEEQISALIDGGDIAPIELPTTDGAETIKVAVTGALPPMDYVAADGTPAGFNTAVLAEIAARTGKNIELVVVDSVGRAAALASGTVDAVFWTRTSELLNGVSALTREELEAKKAEIDAELTQEEIEIMNRISESESMDAYGSADMPQGTIATVPYYSDVFVPVELAQD